MPDGITFQLAPTSGTNFSLAEYTTNVPLNIGSFTAGPPKDFWAEVWTIVSSIFNAVVQGFVQAALTGLKQLEAAFTLNNLVGLAVNYAKQQASTGLTHALMGLGHQQWLANFLHAAGLDFQDLLNVGRNALNAGFGVLTSDLSTAFNKMGLGSDAAAKGLQGSLLATGADISKALALGTQASAIALQDHAALVSKTTAQWSLFTTQNFSGEEAKMRDQLHAIFSPSPDKIAANADIAARQNVVSAGDAMVAIMKSNLPDMIKNAGLVLAPIEIFLSQQVNDARAAFLSLLVPKRPVSYELAGGAALGAFGTAFSLGLGAHVAATAADLIHPFKATGLPQLAAFMADMAGFSVIAKDTWYEDVKNFLGEPYRHYSLRYFRPTLPAERDILDMASKNFILDADADTAMQYWGYRDEWLGPMKEAHLRYPSSFEMSYMLQDPTLPQDETYMFLRHHGYPEAVAATLAGQLLKKTLTTYMSSYRSALSKLYSNGFITDDQFTAQLEPLGLAQEALVLELKTARLNYIYDITNLSVTMYKTMFEKDLINDADLETALAALGVVKEKRDVIVGTERIKLSAKVAAAEKAQIQAQVRKEQTAIVDTYLNAYRGGLIDDATLLQDLKLAGLTDDVANLTLSVEQQKSLIAVMKKAARTKNSVSLEIEKTLEKAYVMMFRRDQIDAPTLESFLIYLGLDDVYAASVVNFEVARKAKPGAVKVG